MLPFGTMGPPVTTWRQVPVLREDFNAFKRHRFVNFQPNFSSPNFGRTRGTNLPRFIQLGVSVRFAF